MPDVWQLAAVFTKFALYLGVLASAGTVLAALLFRLDHVHRVAAAFAGLGLVATVLVFLLRAANLTGDAGGMTDPEMLGLLWSTPVGTALSFRIAGLVLLIIGLPMGRIGLWVSALGGILAVCSFAQVGHIAVRGNVPLSIALTLHLIAVAVWIGVLTPLRRLASATATHSAAADLGHRFGKVAQITVPALLIAGVFMGYVLVGSIPALWKTGYGQAVIIKVLLVAALLGLAAANKLRFIPKLRSGDPIAAHNLTRSIWAEWLVVLTILAVTTVLTSNLSLPT